MIPGEQARADRGLPTVAELAQQADPLWYAHLPGTGTVHRPAPTATRDDPAPACSATPQSDREWQAGSGRTVAVYDKCRKCYGAVRVTAHLSGGGERQYVETAAIEETDVEGAIETAIREIERRSMGATWLAVDAEVERA